ncbi:hypothetical protein [Bradyrhizobium sp. USDA 4502]
MRTGVSNTITPTNRHRLEAVGAGRNAAQKHEWRTVIVLLSADEVGTNEIMRRTGKSKTCVWLWQERFITAGVTGLLRDKTRPSRVKPLGIEVAERMVALMLADPSVEATLLTANMMAKKAGMNAGAVRRIWKAHGLEPHRCRQLAPRALDLELGGMPCMLGQHSAGIAPRAGCARSPQRSHEGGDVRIVGDAS